MLPARRFPPTNNTRALITRRVRIRTKYRRMVVAWRFAETNEHFNVGQTRTRCRYTYGTGERRAWTVCAERRERLIANKTGKNRRYAAPTPKRI